MTFNCHDLIVQTGGLIACATPTVSGGETCAGPSCGYPSLGVLEARNSGEHGLALLRQQLRQIRLESELSN
jgi:hypothetical protein